jgi:hypothetical protein
LIVIERIKMLVGDLVDKIYNDNYSHLDFMDNMGGEDCDCNIHIALNTIVQYWGIDVGV